MHSNTSLRPFMVAPATQDVIAAAVAGGLQGGGLGGAGGQHSFNLQAASASTIPNLSHHQGLGPGLSAFTLPGGIYPELALFSQFGQIYPQHQQQQGGNADAAGAGQSPAQANQQGNAAAAAAANQLAQLNSLPAKLPIIEDLSKQMNRAGGRTRSSDSRSSSAYASRHQAAEQRRRTRINERLELLRKMVPHAERANTACFLEEVIKYIDSLKRRTIELENAVHSLKAGKPVPNGAVEAVPATAHDVASTAAAVPSSVPPQAAALQAAAAAVAATNNFPNLGQPGLQLSAELQASLQNLNQHLYQPGTSKPYLSFNEELFPSGGAKADGQVKPGGGPATPTPSIKADVAPDVNLPALVDARKALSSSPVSSEESGVPLKKRKVLVL